MLLKKNYDDKISTNIKNDIDHILDIKVKYILNSYFEKKLEQSLIEIKNHLEVYKNSSES